MTAQDNNQEHQKPGRQGGTHCNGRWRYFISGMEDRKLRAFDKATGKLLWQTPLPAANSTTACTYQANGKQYIALSVGGTKENPSGCIMAFALP